MWEAPGSILSTEGSKNSFAIFAKQAEKNLRLVESIESKLDFHTIIIHIVNVLCVCVWGVVFAI